MAVAKVILNGTTLIDVTQKTVTASTLLQGETALKNDGTDVTGTYVPQTAVLQTKSATYTPTTSAQTDTITPDVGYDGMDEVDITINAVATGTAGTPTATKGTVSNHAVSVTPSVTNATGYITGGTINGTAVSVSASELVSGTLSITSSGTKDVTNYASASVASGSATTPATSITANPTISVSASGLITASVSGSQSVTPSVSAGYVASGTAGTVTVSGSNTQQLSTQSAQTITPTTTNQTIASGKYLTGVQTILGDANLLAENIKKDVVIFGITGTYEGESSGAEVYVALLNPYHPSSFNYCEIYELYSNDIWDVGSKIGEITSASGNTTVTVGSSVYGFVVQLSGTSVSIPNEVICNGNVSLIGIEYDRVGFAVTGNGTVSIAHVDYND